MPRKIDDALGKFDEAARAYMLGPLRATLVEWLRDETADSEFRFDLPVAPEPGKPIWDSFLMTFRFIRSRHRQADGSIFQAVNLPGQPPQALTEFGLVLQRDRNGNLA